MNCLNSDITNRISAEQTLQDIVSVTKELLENSLDAEATTISIVLRENGIVSIEVTDNGFGIKRSSLTKLCEQGSTSKIEKLSDIDSLQTLGFRGQALFAISRLGKLQICTRHKDDITGYKLQIENGTIQKISAESMKTGTKMLVFEIFYNNPVRLNDLRQRAQFYRRKIIELVDAYSLINYDKKLSLTDIGTNERIETLVEPFLTNDILSKLKIYLGKQNSETFKEYKLQSQKFFMTVLISNPQALLKKKVKFFFLNKRLIEVPDLIKKMIKNAFKEFVNPCSYVICIYMKDGFDVNVSANKMMAYLDDEKQIAEEFAELLKKIADDMAGFCKMPDPGLVFNNKIHEPAKRKISDDGISTCTKLLKLDSNNPLQTGDKPVVFINQPKTEPISKQQKPVFATSSRPLLLPKLKTEALSQPFSNIFNLTPSILNKTQENPVNLAENPSINPLCLQSLD